MKLFKKAQLNNKGFGHIELLLVIVVLVAIAGVGFFVYKHDNKKTNVAHAGGWTVVTTGTTNGIPFTGEACFDNAGGYGTYVRGFVVTKSAVPQNTYIEMISFNGNYPPYQANWSANYDNGWLYGVYGETNYHLVSLKVTNYLQVYPIVPGKGANYTAATVRAGSLAAC